MEFMGKFERKLVVKEQGENVHDYVLKILARSASNPMETSASASICSSTKLCFPGLVSTKESRWRVARLMHGRRWPGKRVAGNTVLEGVGWKRRKYPDVSVAGAEEWWDGGIVGCHSHAALLCGWTYGTYSTRPPYSVGAVLVGSAGSLESNVLGLRLFVYSYRYLFVSIRNTNRGVACLLRSDTAASKIATTQRLK